MFTETQSGQYAWRDCRSRS